MTTASEGRTIRVSPRESKLKEKQSQMQSPLVCVASQLTDALAFYGSYPSAAAYLLESLAKGRPVTRLPEPPGGWSKCKNEASSRCRPQAFPHILRWRVLTPYTGVTKMSKLLLEKVND